MEMAESLIQCMLTTAQQEQHEKDQQNIKEIEQLKNYMDKNGETCNCSDFDE